MRLPRNITVQEGCYRVRVNRAGMRFNAWVPGQSAEALALAVKKRDEFIRMAGIAAWSNTGMPGVSESVYFKRGAELHGFVVNFNQNGRRTCRRISYGAQRTRAEAFLMAVNLRRRMEPGVYMPAEGAL